MKSDKEDYQQRLAELCEVAFSNDTAAAVIFMLKPHPLLQNRSPGAVAVTAAGALEVEKILRRAMHGIPN